MSLGAASHSHLTCITLSFSISETSLAAVKRNTRSHAEEHQLEEDYDTLLANV